MFTMTNLHQASLPTVRAEFYAISQRENESILKYTARVDVIVATMAKLGERISTGAWIYALGNGLRPEFKESKDGILYSKDGYNTVLKVKTKLQNEEAVLLAKKARSPTIASDTATPTIAKPVDIEQISQVMRKGKVINSYGETKMKNRFLGCN